MDSTILLLPGMNIAAFCLFACLGQGRPLSQNPLGLRVPCCAAVGFVGLVLGTFVYSVWIRLLKPLVGPTSRWRQQTSSLLALLLFALVVFHAYPRSSGLAPMPEQDMIHPSWSGREPTLLARVHPSTSLTSWVGSEALPDFLAGQSSPRVMSRTFADLAAPQATATAMTGSSGLLAPPLSASTLGRFQLQDPLLAQSDRARQTCCKPYELQQQQLHLGWASNTHSQNLAHSAHTLALVRAVFKRALTDSTLPSDLIGTYLASRSLSLQQLLLRQAEYAYAISVFQFASLAIRITEAQHHYAAQCVWTEQRTSLVQLVQGVCMAPLNSTRATHQQQLPGMSGLVLNSLSSSPSAWAWSHITSLAAVVGRPSHSMAPRGSNTSAIILEQEQWDQVCPTEAEFTNTAQFCHRVLGSSKFHSLWYFGLSCKYA